MARKGRRQWLLQLVVAPTGVPVLELQLVTGLALGAAAVFFFRVGAAEALAAALLASVLVLALLWAGFHRLGLRRLGRYQPGFLAGVVATLFFVAVCPPGLPLPFVIGLAAIATLAEGRLRHLRHPVAMRGALVAWALAWALHARLGLGYLSAFDLRSLDEPIRLWMRFQLSEDPVRLFVGNVPGPYGATSLGLVGAGVLLLGYARRISWPYLAAFFATLAIGVVLMQQPLATFLLSGPALGFAALLGAEVDSLPPQRPWAVAAGLLAGAGTLSLFHAGVGGEAYGAGVAGAALLLSVLQVAGLAGSGAPAVPAPAMRLDGATAFRLAALVVFAPAGLLLVWRDRGMQREQKVSLVAIGAGFYVVIGLATAAWVLVLRWPG